MIVKTSDPASIAPYLKNLVSSKKMSHKGQNGKLLIIGGSTLFHAASLWAADIASKIVDMVHYCSTKENEAIFVNLKTKFGNGMVIKQEHLLDYVTEDDCILLGPGFIRGEKPSTELLPSMTKILNIKNEAHYAYYLTQFLLRSFPDKKFIIDAGSLQMMEKEWLKSMKSKAIITPHQKEFTRLFGIDITKYSLAEKMAITKKTAAEYNCIILLKAVDDIISDGHRVVIVEGGNPGLTKGGTGDVLAGLCASLATQNDQLISCVVASYLLKKAAEDLSKTVGTWYTTSDLITQIPQTYHAFGAMN